MPYSSCPLIPCSSLKKKIMRYLLSSAVALQCCLVNFGWWFCLYVPLRVDSSRQEKHSTDTAAGSILHGTKTPSHQIVQQSKYSSVIADLYRSQRNLCCTYLIPYKWLIFVKETKKCAWKYL